jgi:hypothetical protein
LISQRRLDPEALSVVARADADRRCDLRVGRELHLGFAGDELQRAEKAGGVAGGKELLGIGALAAIAAEFLRRVQRHLQAAVLAAGRTRAAAGGRAFGGVEDLHDASPATISERPSGAVRFK